jgi:GNAT superfamily N-acetyltransferase
MLTVVQVETDEHIRLARELFLEYFDFLRTDVDKVDDLDQIPPLTGYKEELAELPGRYAAPDGRLLLALYDGEAAGCVAFYRFGSGICEVKRLWTRRKFRGKQMGRTLVETLVSEARKSGYSTMLLSTVDILTEAIALYRSVGFEPTEPFFEMSPELLEHELFMKLELVP